MKENGFVFISTSLSSGLQNYTLITSNVKADFFKMCLNML